MAEKTNANIGFEKELWDAACVLWGHIPATEYRNIIIGLIFLRYISCAFEECQKKIVQMLRDEGETDEEYIQSELEIKDNYLEHSVFFVPAVASWSHIADMAHDPKMGKVIDDAMKAIEDENPSLKGVLPKHYANEELDKVVLGKVVDIFTNIDMTEHYAAGIAENLDVGQLLLISGRIRIMFIGRDLNIITGTGSMIIHSASIKRNIIKNLHV